MRIDPRGTAEWKLANPEKWAARQLSKRLNGIGYRANNGQELKAKRAAAEKADPERFKAYKRRDYERHREAYIARAKRHHLENRPQKLAAMKEYRKLHAEEHKAYKKRRYHNDIDRFRKEKRDYARIYYRRNKEKLLNRSKEWMGKNKWYKTHVRRLRRARLAGARIDHSARHFYKWVRSQEYVQCAYCGVPVEGKKAHIDHIIAIARGGAHVQANLAASCSSCNLKKGVLSPDEFRKRKLEENHVP